MAIGGLFAGESMFHVERDASKVALAALVDLMTGSDADLSAGETPGQRLIDVQWLTPHLSSLGAIEVTRAGYLNRLARALSLPLPSAFTHR
ncbi:MAG: hypothetical protein V9F00_13040 [Nocardioides sp.]